MNPIFSNPSPAHQVPAPRGRLQAASAGSSPDGVCAGFSFPRPCVGSGRWYLGWRRVLLRLGVVAPANRLKPGALADRRMRAARLFALAGVLR